jgi:SAM-dependent methyltransferase
MAFSIAGDVYDRFMGRYSRELAPRFIGFAGVAAGMRALDVGCGPGALAAALAAGIGTDHVAAADPSQPLLAACAERVPGADVRQAAADALPWADDAFDAALAQLVVNFLPDPVAGAREMARVTRPGGMVAACTWDYGDGMTMLHAFWESARALDPGAPDEARTMAIQTAADLRGVWEAAGIENVETGELVVETGYRDFDDLWQPFLGGPGPAGAYTAALEPERQDALREQFRARLGSPEGPFALSARAWAVRGLAYSTGSLASSE